MNKGTKLVFYYLHSLKGIFDEPVLIYYSLSNDDLIIHALNCLELDFKEIVIVVHGRDNPISFEELHDKLVEHETFLQGDESWSKFTPIIVNDTHGNGDKNWNMKTHQHQNHNQS